MKYRQRGGFVLGLVVGIVAGIVVSLGVALYVTKVPVPFVNKVQQRTAEQEAAEIEKNRNWDPNSPLYGKNPARPASGPIGTLPTPGTPPVAGVPPLPPNAPATTAPAPGQARVGSDVLGDVPAAGAPTVPQPPATRATPDPFAYFVQAGAFGRGEDAEQQRARLAMLGFRRGSPSASSRAARCTGSAWARSTSATMPRRRDRSSKEAASSRPSSVCRSS